MLPNGGKILPPFYLLNKGGKVRGEALYLAPRPVASGFTASPSGSRLHTEHLYSYFLAAQDQAILSQEAYGVLLLPLLIELIVGCR